VQPGTQARRRANVGLRLALVLALLGFLASTPGDRSPSSVAPLAADGPPSVLRIWPQAGPVAGGTPVRITGQGFEGTSEVRFGEEPAPDFAVVEGGTVLTAVAPPAPPGEPLVAVTVIDDGATTTSPPLFLYTDATLTVTPDTDLGAGDPVVAAVDGYQPATFAVVAEASPLGAILENGPPAPVGPSPYADPVAFPVTDAAGVTEAPATLMSPFGSARDRGYDDQIACPPTQAAANVGLGQCALTFGQDGAGALERPIALAGEGVPANPVLLLSAQTTAVGDTVHLGGQNWNAAPWFGSATTPERPGETLLTVEICDDALTTCAPAVGEATVGLTRYVDGDPAVQGVQGTFGGATLDGSFTFDDASGCAPDCRVRVRQQRFDPVTGTAVPDVFIEATASLTDPADLFYSYSPVSGAPGTRVAFFGNGADWITAVSFVDPANTDPPGSGTSFAGLDFTIDGPGLASVTVPEGPTGLVDVVVESSVAGTEVIAGGFFVITPDLIVEVEPTTGLRPGDTVTVTVRNYVPDAGVVIAMVSPLINYVQPAPGTTPYEGAPPPQAGVLGFSSTDSDGNMEPFTVFMPEPFSVLDEQAQCPVPQEQANAGLGSCILSITLFGQGILEVPISFADDAVPEAPSLGLDVAEADPGDVVALSGQSWHGQPLLDSTTANGALTVELCGIGGNAATCRFVGTGDVLRTRYLFDWRDRASGQLSGGSLAGSLTVPDDLGGPCEFTVRVRQDVAGTTGFLEATAPLSIRALEEPAVTTTTEAPPAVTTTTRPAAVTTTTRPPSTTTTAEAPATTTTRPPSTTTTTRPPSTTTTTSPPPPPTQRTEPPPPRTSPPPPGPVQPPPVPPGPASPVINLGALPSPTPVQVPGLSPAPGNPVTNPGSAHVKEEKAEAAEASRHHFVRHDAGSEAVAAQGAAVAAAVAAAGAGCFLLLGPGAAQRRRSSTCTSDGRPRPRSAHP